MSVSEHENTCMCSFSVYSTDVYETLPEAWHFTSPKGTETDEA